VAGNKPTEIRRRAESPDTKSGRFTRLAERRVSRTLHELWLVGNLSNRRNYQYTKEQADQLLAALDVGMRQLRTRFLEETPARTQAFRFRR